MPIVKWPIPIIDRLADNRPIPIIGPIIVRYRLSADNRCTSTIFHGSSVLSWSYF